MLGLSVQKDKEEEVVARIVHYAYVLVEADARSVEAVPGQVAYEARGSQIAF